MLSLHEGPLPVCIHLDRLTDLLFNGHSNITEPNYVIRAVNSGYGLSFRVHAQPVN